MQKTGSLLNLCGIIFAAFLGGCQIGPSPAAAVLPTAPAPSATVSGLANPFPALDETSLKNGDFTVDSLGEFLPENDRGQTIKLVDGKFRYVYQAGAATELLIQFVQAASGDLNADSRPDAAVLLQVWPGGSGTFTFLAVALNENGQPKIQSAVLLGDRVKIDNLAIKDGVITVDLLSQGPTDPMCCPSVKTHLRYRLQNGVLTPL